MAPFFILLNDDKIVVHINLASYSCFSMGLIAANCA